MIINTGQRTDIPAFYAKWFANRLREGVVCVRNPFNPKQVSRYRLDPSVVDVIGFCTKNPAPMFPYMEMLSDYGQYWFVTITPYGKDIEPNVPDKHKIITDFQHLSNIVGINSIGWRYDPILISDRYTIEYHIQSFEQIAKALSGYTRTAVISFIDLYEKVKRNFAEARTVNKDDQLYLGKEMIKIADRYGMDVKPCAEGNILKAFGADCNGCMTVNTYETAIGNRLNVPNRKPNRKECACYIACDIGAYDTCMHLCKYCYANNDPKLVKVNHKFHDPDSPFLIGNYEDDDIIHDVKQESWIDNQMTIGDFHVSF